MASNGEWLSVQPLPGHAIVNLGDAMVKFSDGLLKSNMQRVITIPELSEEVDRYSVVYLMEIETLYERFLTIFFK